MKDELIEQIKDLGFPFLKKKGNFLYFTSDDGSTQGRMNQLEVIHSKIGGMVKSQASGSRSGRIEVDKYKIVLKPSSNAKGPSEVLKIYSSTLTREGHNDHVEWHGEEIETSSFEDHEELIESIENGLRSNHSVDEKISEFVLESLKQERMMFSWPDWMNQNIRNELGKYLGELIIGILSLRGDLKDHSVVTWDAKKFHVPKDSSFNAVDSWIDIHHEIIPVSSKYGQGAKASFFANILDTALNSSRTFKPSRFTSIVNTAKELDLKETRRCGNQVLYQYGIREVLGMDQTKIEKPIEVYHNIRKMNYDSECVVMVDGEIRKRTEHFKIIDNLPNSVSGFLSRNMASELNACSQSMDQMKNLISSKSFFQVSLDHGQWNDGNVSFDVQHVDSVDLKISGSASALTNVQLKQGILNYEIRPVLKAK